MQRGKAPVQHYQDGGQEMFKMLESETGDAISMKNRQRAGNGADECECQPQNEMAGHIVDQLRRAYDELLHEPVPDHLRQLLTQLSDAEDKS
jgi:hypothetical protein